MPAQQLGRHRRCHKHALIWRGLGAGLACRGLAGREPPPPTHSTVCVRGGPGPGLGAASDGGQDQGLSQVRQEVESRSFQAPLFPCSFTFIHSLIHSFIHSFISLANTLARSIILPSFSFLPFDSLFRCLSICALLLAAHPSASPRYASRLPCFATSPPSASAGLNSTTTRLGRCYTAPPWPWTPRFSP